MFYYITKYKCFSTDNSQHKVWKRAFFYAFVLLRITEIFLPSQPSGPNLPSQFPGFFYLSKLVFTYSVYIPLFTQSHPQDFSNNCSIILLVLVAIYAKIIWVGQNKYSGRNLALAKVLCTHLLFPHPLLINPNQTRITLFLIQTV